MVIIQIKGRDSNNNDVRVRDNKQVGTQDGYHLMILKTMLIIQIKGRDDDSSKIV